MRPCYRLSMPDLDQQQAGLLAEAAHA